MSSDNDDSVPGSSLKLEVIRHFLEKSVVPTGPIAETNPRMVPVGRAGLKQSRFREGVTRFITRQKDSSALNVIVDLLMVAFGLGATAGILAVIVVVIRLFAG